VRYTDRTAMALSVMETEIRSQPAMLARLAEEAAPLVRELGRAVARRRPRFAVLAARGSSDHAAIYGKYLLETQAGLVASLAAPSVYSVYGRSPDVRDALAIGISQSGQSPDIVSAIDGARRGGALALAITNDETSPLARAADLVLPLGVGLERSVAATKTFTAELLALWLLVGAIAGADPAPARHVAEHAARALAAAEQALAGFMLGGAASPVVVAGRGYSFPIALEVALKLREVGVRNAQGFSAADLLHGHIAAVQADTAAVVAGTAGPSLPSLRECVAALRARGARTVVVSDDAALRESADIAVPVETATESLAVIPMTVVGQWLTLQDAVARGLDPDRPPGLTKIVRTV
jgi:glucosamine--fructose-6-phosphate aminotransferase (isomerizing)